MLVPSDQANSNEPVEELLNSLSTSSSSGLISEYLGWFLISWCMYLVYRKLSHLGWHKIVLIFLLASPIFILIQELLRVFVSKVIGLIQSSLLYGFWEEVRIGTSLIKTNTFFDVLLIYIFIMVALLALDFYRKYREQEINAFRLEGALTQAQLQHLKMQLQPHFLFNSLNTVTMLIRRNLYENAIDVTTGLSDLLRSSLTVEKKQFITLEQEMSLIQKYLTIEKVRFTDKLAVEIEVKPEVEAALVPNLLLQPIVENAFKHGLSKSLKHNLLQINASKLGENLSITVYNIGPPLDPEWSLDKFQGIGLSNTRERLNRLFGPKASFEIKNHDQGVQVSLLFPFITEYHGTD